MPTTNIMKLPTQLCCFILISSTIHIGTSFHFSLLSIPKSSTKWKLGKPKLRSKMPMIVSDRHNAVKKPMSINGLCSIEENFVRYKRKSRTGLQRGSFMKATGLLIMFMSLFVITRVPALASTTTESIATTTIGATETSIAQVTSGLATATASTYNTPSLIQPRPLGSFKLIPTLEEIEFAFRLIFASCIGASIGRERSTTHRHAGVRTMALVSLGACAFTLCSLYGFLPEINKMSEFFPTATNYVKVDPSRMASSVASGVGFIGAGVITNNKRSDGENSVRGLTTAAAIWVSKYLYD